VHPDQVQIKSINTEAGIKFLVRLDPHDMGRAIGIDGQTVKAIRAILSGIAMAGNVWP